MFLMDYSTERGWHSPRIEPYHDLTLDPVAIVLHYNQQVFEGLKAYHLPDGGIGLFRPDKNVERMNASTERMVMPSFDAETFLAAVKELVLLDRYWLPTSEGTAIYIRPTMIATEAALGVQPSDTYLFFIVLSPVGPYYKEGFNPTRIFVSEEYIRAARGGVGNTKTSGKLRPYPLCVRGGQGEGLQPRSCGSTPWSAATSRRSARATYSSSSTTNW